MRTYNFWGTCIAKAILCLAGITLSVYADSIPKVLNGIDVLRQQNFMPLAGKRIGLITNHTGVAADGTSTIDLFNNSEECQLVALFSPEHGIRGIVDGSVDSATDESTGLPVYSLYGKTRRPTPEMLQQVEALVFDIQDIGARFYTYITTMAYCMEAAAAADIPFYVLDRPNPIGGEHVEGPLLDGDKTSFVGYMPLPVRHGMTVGELARYFNQEGGIGVRLHVVEMRGWHRTYYFGDTGQLWINPSPNMRNMLAATLYPGVCLLEGTNVSVGRGTERPFEMIGAPWIEPRRFADTLKSDQPEGVEFIPVFFTPDAGTNAGMPCGGVHILVTDREKFHSVRLGLNIIAVLHRLYPDIFKMGNIVQLLGNAEAMGMLNSGRSPDEVLRAGRSEMQKFLIKRRKALVYDPIR